MWQEAVNQGVECVEAVELTSGSKSLPSPSGLALACPCLAGSGGCPRFCLPNLPGSRVTAGIARVWLSRQRESQNPRAGSMAAGTGALCSMTVLKGKFALRGVYLRGSVALSWGRRTFPVTSQTVNSSGCPAVQPVLQTSPLFSAQRRPGGGLRAHG